MKIVKNMIAWFRDLSLNRKISILVLAAGVLPIGIVFTVSLTELKKLSGEQQIYAVNQGYTQVFQAVEDKLDRIYNISTLLAVNDTINQNIVLSGQEGNIAGQLTRFENISSYINSMEMASESNNIVFYIDRAALTADNQTGRFRSVETARDLEWYAQLEANNGRPTWVNYKEELYDRDYVSVTRKLWNPNNYNESIGILAVLFERKYLEEMLVGYLESQMMYLETAEGTLLASNVPEEELMRLPLGERMINEEVFERKYLPEGEYLVCSRIMEKSNVYLISLIPVDALEREINLVNMRLQMIYVVISLFILVAIVPLTGSITGRIQLLKGQMIQIQKGVIGKVETKEKYNDEIGQLITHYNEMVGKVEELMQEQYQLGQKKTEAELMALQSQINPHFLYNTLDMINWMAQKSETDNIRNVVQAMSRFYRLTLSKGHDIVMIGDEIRMCEAYMEIQRCRYKGRIRYEVEVDEEISRYLIPKITLQPFLENAIVHGINEKDDARGTVILTGWMEDGRVTLSVTDDGNGMSESDKSKSHTGSHYGMENIAQRLELFYGEKIPIQVESSLGIGTCIVINIPARTEREAGEKRYAD